MLDESAIDSPVRYESVGEGSAFPHVYGPVSLDAVVDSFQFERDDTGYRLPSDLFRY